VLTKYLCEQLKERGIDEARIVIAPDATDVSRFFVSDDKESCRERMGLPHGKDIVLYAGHLYEWKGADVLLEVARHMKGVVFVFVGGTKDDLQKFKQEAARLDTVLIVGHRPHAEMPAYMRAADVLVLPNSAKEKISSHHTSPLKLFEYMASGTPIVASDLPSITEILSSDSATLVSPDNPKALAEGIREVLADKEGSQKRARRAQEVVQGYTWDKRAKTILAAGYGKEE
jgi:glycosyltransferase involved in cell wall biosynthesis